MGIFKKVWHAFVASMFALGFQLEAFAQSSGIDVSALKTEISGQKGSITEIGLAILGIIVAAAVFMWIRKVIR